MFIFLTNVQKFKTIAYIIMSTRLKDSLDINFNFDISENYKSYN